VIHAFLYLLITAGVGHAIACAIDRGTRRSGIERFALAVTLGVAAVPMILFWLSISGIGVRSGTIWILGGIALGVITWDKLRHRQRQVLLGWEKPTGAEGIVLLIGGVLLIWSGSEMVSAALIDGVSIWDAFSIWMLKAKVLAGTDLRPMPEYFQTLSLSYSHLDYPLSVPMLAAGAMVFTGGETDGLMKLPQLLVVTGLVATLVSLLMRFVSLSVAVLLTAIAISSFAVIRFGGSGTADLTMIMMSAALLARLLAWYESGRISDAILAGIFASGAVFTKNEGLAVAVIYVGVFVFATVLHAIRARTSEARAIGSWTDTGAFATRRVGVIRLVTLAGLTSLPWLLWSASIPRTHEDYGGRIRVANVVSNIDRVPEIARAFHSSMTDWTGWGGVWFILVASAIIGARAFRHRGTSPNPAAVLWVVLLCHWLTVVLVLLISPWEVRDVAGVALDRVLSHSSPCAVALIGAHLWTMRRLPAT
jgi:hypothetical protein